MENLMAEDYFNMSRAVRPWNKALNALDFQNYRYRYFTLKEAPAKPKSKILDKFGHLANKNYFQVQGQIEDLVNLLINQQENQIDDNVYKTVVNQLMKKQANAIEKEATLFRAIMYEQYQFSPGDETYEAMIRNSEVNASSNVLQGGNVALKWNELNRMSSIEFWTRMANNSFTKEGDSFVGKKIRMSWTEFSRFAFGCVVQSTAIYNKLKSKREQSFFSRHLAINDKQKSKNLGVANSKLAMEVLEENFRNWAADISANLNEEIGRELSNSFYSAMNIWFDVKTTKAGKVKLTYKKGKQNTSAETVSATLRGRLEDTLQSLSARPDLRGLVPGKIEFTNSADKVFFRASLNSSTTATNLNEGDFYSIITTLFLRDEGKDLRKRKDLNQYFESNPNAKRKLINYFFEVLKMGIDEMYEEKLQVENLGTLNIKNFIENLEDKTICHNVRDFYAAARAMCGNIEQMNYLFNTPDLVDAAYKSFNVADSNAFLSGLLGEIAGLYNLNNMTKIMGQLTGANVFSAIKGYGAYGQSVNDIKGTYKYSENDKRKQITIGANIKHYVSSKNEVELYSSERGISVFKNTIGKYLGYDDTMIIRFMLENSHYFDKKDTSLIQEIGTFISYKHLSEFYRVYDHDKHSVINLFYILNNVCYPLSYIYYCIIERLKEKRFNKNLGLLTFKTRKANGKSSEYSDYSVAIKDYRDSEWKLGNKRNGVLDGTIKTEGLKINLVKLDLF